MVGQSYTDFVEQINTNGQNGQRKDAVNKPVNDRTNKKKFKKVDKHFRDCILQVWNFHTYLVLVTFR